MTFDTVLDGSDLVGRRTLSGWIHVPVWGFLPATTNSIERGVDIVVGTPGRIKDHIGKVNIDLGALKFRVLVEADEMLRMGFVEYVEHILGKVEDARKVQTLLFSATLPAWVKQVYF